MDDCLGMPEGYLECQNMSEFGQQSMLLLILFSAWSVLDLFRIR